nr:unnamed protein product [Digitaria exilis]
MARTPRAAATRLQEAEAAGLAHCRDQARASSRRRTCEDGHVVCGTCRVSHGQACASAATYNPCAAVDAFVRDAKLPCAFQGHGCGSYVVYYQASDHERAVSYGKPYRIPVPRPATQAQGLHVLVGQEDQCVFLVVTSPATKTATAFVSVVCARANGDAALGVAQFKCTLWADAQRGNGTVGMLTFPVGSSDLSGGFSPEEQGLFLAVTPKMHDASGEGAGLVVRIDRAGRVAANTFASYGCDERVRYTEKRSHEESCEYAPYDCPLDGCGYRGPELYDHVRGEHDAPSSNPASAAAIISYARGTTVAVRKAAPSLVLVQPGRRPVFALLNGGDVLAGRSLSLVFLGPRPEEEVEELEYTMEVTPGGAGGGGGPGALALSASGTVPCARRIEGFQPGGFLFVPDAYWGDTGKVSVRVRV